MESIPKHEIKKKYGKNKGKFTYTPLNKWIMNLSGAAKRTFFEKALNNDALFDDLPRDKKLRKDRLNNWRYKELPQPNNYRMLFCYTSAIHADPNLKIKTIFPYLPDNLIEQLLPALIQSSNKSNNFNTSCLRLSEIT